MDSMSEYLKESLSESLSDSLSESLSESLKEFLSEYLAEYLLELVLESLSEPLPLSGGRGGEFRILDFRLRREDCRLRRLGHLAKRWRELQIDDCRL